MLTHMILRSLTALPFLALVACGSDPHQMQTPATSEAVSQPAQPAPSAPQAVPPPSVPPQAVEKTQAHYIIDIPKSVTTPSATVCSDDKSCDALLPPNPPVIARYFTQEAWVVIAVPAGYAIPTVASDGTTVTVKLAKPGPVKDAHLTLYRVASSVKKAVVVPTP